jgi:hypothetical protein
MFGAFAFRSVTSGLEIAHAHITAWEFAVILRLGEQHIDKGRSLGAFEVAQALVLRHIHYVMRFLLRLAARRGARRCCGRYWP